MNAGTVRRGSLAFAVAACGSLAIVIAWLHAPHNLGNPSRYSALLCIGIAGAIALIAGLVALAAEIDHHTRTAQEGP